MADTSLLMSTYWDWANTDDSKKFNAPVQVYKNNFSDTTIASSYAVTVSKNKIRGKGRALQVYFESATGKDAEIVGWGIWFNKNARP